MSDRVVIGSPDAPSKAPVAKDYSGQALSEHDFSGARLAGAKFVDADLTGANFFEAELVGADLRRAKLTDANLTLANLTRAKLDGADLSDAILSGALLLEAQLVKSDLTRANLEPAPSVATASKSSFIASNLTRANLHGAILKEAKLNGANLTGAVLDDANLEKANLEGADLTHASLKLSRLEDSGIDGAHMPGADLSGAVSSTLQKRLESRLAVAKDQADRLRNAILAVVAFCAYVVPTACMTKDALVLTNLTTMDLPIINAKVSVHAFFSLSALVCVALLSYLLSLVSYFARVVSRLPAQLPDGPPLREQVDPWVLGCVGVLRQPDLTLLGESELGRAVRNLFEMLGEQLPSKVARWVAPLTLGVLVFRFFVACRF